ncbi:leucine-rich repeat domain-containing protein [Hoylesella marshii]|uniref:leucine-rich repeat domain-containing protein n=1 Tax=Hoylesella marshii TaxID=189722 RepID=UPI000A3E52FA|nr:leucine-rich repeat domain-containing protein [Hoylesella marshii]
MKRLLLSFVALACIAAKAQTTFQVGDMTYLVKDNQRVELTKYAGTAASVTIPATVTHEGTTYDVKSIGEKAFLWTHVETAVLPASIDSIKEQAFYYSYLKSVNFPDGLKYIGNRSFASCKMTSIDVPGSVEVIDDNAFFSCPLLEEITFHEGLKKIGQAAFYHNPKLTRIVFPNSLEYIGKTASTDAMAWRRYNFHLTSLISAQQLSATVANCGKRRSPRRLRISVMRLS